MHLRDRLATAPVAFATAFAFALGLGWFFLRVWHATPLFFAYNVPIALPFAAFFLDRLMPRPVPARLAAIDAVAVGLALLRVVAPPLPFASGHTLFTAYAALTARRWPLRVLASAVLLEVLVIKLWIWRAPGSPALALALAAMLAGIARRSVVSRDRSRAQSLAAAKSAGA
jgi:hypothetical protein